MGKYTSPGWAKAYTQLGFAIALAFAVGYFLNSPFLGFLTLAVLAYYPIDDEDSEAQINGVVFAGIMFILLLWAFGFFKTLNLSLLSGAEGLGIELGIQTGYVHVIALMVFMGVTVFKGISIVAGGKQSKNADTQIFDAGFVIFMFVVFVINIIVFEPWNWNFSAIIFAAIWLFTFLNGIFGGKEMKQTFGVVIIVIAFLIYTFGIGSDQVGAAAFGNWWPPVKEFGKQVFDPIKDAALTMYKSFKDSMQLLLCPTCVARDVLQGVYANPTGKGKVGAFGVEFEDLSVPDGSIALARPFNINLGIKNVGAKEAKDVKVRLRIGGENVNSFRTGTDFDKPTKDNPNPPLHKISFPLPQEDAKQLPVNGQITCVNLPNLRDVVQPIGNLETIGRKIASGVEYVSTIGTDKTSQSASDYKFNTSFVNIRAEAEYKYSIDSQLQLEFISKTERERLLKEKTLERKKVRSQMTTSPVALSLFVDIDQPIEEKTNFFLGVEATAQEPDGEASGVVVEIKLPKDFVGDISKAGDSAGGGFGITGAIKKPSAPKDQERLDWYEIDLGKNTLKWHVAGNLRQENNINQTKRLFLDFPQGRIDLKGIPTKNFVVTAKADDFTFTKWKETTVSYSFGGYCCKELKIDGQCRTGTHCEKTTEELGNCVVDGQGSTSILTEDQTLPGGKFYCKSGLRTACLLGMGGCEGGVCSQTGKDINDEKVCKSIEGVSVNVCCNKNGDDASCGRTFNNWLTTLKKKE